MTMKIRSMQSPLHSLYKLSFCSLFSVRLNLIVGLLLSLGWVSGHAQGLTVQLDDSEGNPISGAVVEIILPEEMRSTYQLSDETEVDQLDKEFVPHISTVVSGSDVTFPNSDDILHHVYSFSSISTFNIPLYGKGTQNDYSHRFSETGVVEIGCNIHDWMLAYIYVAQTTLNSISDDSGQATLENVPSGTFELRIWHSRLKEQDIAMTQTIEFVDGEKTVIEYTLELERDRRVRRAPSSNRTRYR